MYLIINEFGDAWMVSGELPQAYLEQGGDGYLDLYQISEDKIARYSSTGDWLPVEELPR